MDGICGAGLEEQGDQRAEGVEQEADDDKIYHQEDDRSAAHGWGCLGEVVKRFVKRA